MAVVAAAVQEVVLVAAAALAAVLVVDAALLGPLSAVLVPGVHRPSPNAPATCLKQRLGRYCPRAQLGCSCAS